MSTPNVDELLYLIMKGQQSEVVDRIMKSGQLALLQTLSVHLGQSGLRLRFELVLALALQQALTEKPSRDLAISLARILEEAREILRLMAFPLHTTGDVYLIQVLAHTDDDHVLEIAQALRRSLAAVLARQHELTQTYRLQRLQFIVDLIITMHTGDFSAEILYKDHLFDLHYQSLKDVLEAGMKMSPTPILATIIECTRQMLNFNIAHAMS